MINCGNIRWIARYELKLLLRNRVLVFFMFLAFIGIPGIQYMMMGRLYFYYLYILPCSLPLVNAILFNVFQSFIVIVLAVDFCVKEKKMDTLHAIQVRNYSNWEYVAGKYAGIILLLSALNVAVILPLFVFHILSDIPFAFWPYVFYFGTLTLPALLFITALTIWVNVVIKTPFFSLIGLIGFLLLDIFFFTDKINGTLDYMAVSIPNVFSELTGHVGLSLYLRQRLCILVVGTACLIFAAVSLSRLDNSLRQRFRLKIFGSLVLLVGLLAGVSYYGHFFQEKQRRKDYIGWYEKYQKASRINILQQSIVYKQEDDRMTVVDSMIICNAGQNDLNEVVLYLNPGLTVTKLVSGEKQINFKRKGQVLLLQDTVKGGTKQRLVISYSGKINEDVCYLDVPDSVYYNTTYSNSLLCYGKHNACISEQFTFLTPECLWVPVSVPPFNPITPYQQEKDLTLFRLTVFHDSALTAVSQGKVLRYSRSTDFINQYPLPGVTLCIGKYQQQSILVDSVSFEIYFSNPQNNFHCLQNASPEGIVSGLKQLTGLFAEKYNRSYPFEKLALIELPVSVSSYSRGGRIGSELVQPELLFQFENWCKSSQFSSLENRRQLMKSMQTEFTDIDIETKYIEGMYRDFDDQALCFPHMNLVDLLSEHQWILRKVKNKVAVAPLYTEFSGKIYAEEFPGIDRIINREPIEDFDVLSKKVGAPAYYKALEYLVSHSMREAFNDPKVMEDIDNILLLKSLYFHKYLYSFLTKQEYDDFLSDLRKRHLFKNIPLAQFSTAFQETFGIDLSNLIRDLYDHQGVPFILIRNIKQNVWRSEGQDSVFLSFDAWNSSQTDGVITCYVNIPEQSFKWEEVKNVVLHAGESVRFFVPLESQIEEIMLHTNFSATLPGNYIELLPDKMEEIFSYPGEGVPIDTNIFLNAPDEIIVDNEDEGFHITRSKSQKTLFGSVIHKEIPEYAETRDFLKQDFVDWIPSLYSNAYGVAKRSFYCKMVGNGESKVEWNANLPEDGDYEVFVYQLELHTLYQMGKDSVAYSYVLNQGDFEADICVGVRVFFRDVYLKDNTGFEDEFSTYFRYGSWISVGTYRLSAGPVRLTLYDRGKTGSFIFADAVKWKKVND